ARAPGAQATTFIDDVRIGQLEPPEPIAAISATATPPPTSSPTSAPPTATLPPPTGTPLPPTPLPGAETIPLADLAPQIPWLPLDEQAVPVTHAYYFNPNVLPFDNRLVRQALALAVDRAAVANLARDVGFAQARPATTFTHPDTLGRDLYGQVGLPFDPDRARSSLAQAGYPNGQGFPPVALVIGPSPMHEALAGAVIEMWRDNLGIEVELQKVGENFFDYLAYLESDRPGLFRLGWAVDVNDPNNSLNEALHSGSEHNLGQFASAEFDRLVEEAAGPAVNDPAARQALYIQAERILAEQEAAVIPLFHGY
ncbi:MAG: ABC transporter substrate-binding protein, partial [Anaerolineae bacterium]